MSENDDRLVAAAENIAEALTGINQAIRAHPEIEFALKVLDTLRAEESRGQTLIDKAREMEKGRTYHRITELAGAALTVDGAHHKQWFLEAIFREIGMDPDLVDHPRGVAP